MTDPFRDLATLSDHVWARLARGVEHADDPFRLMTFATSGREGPEARMVALRRVDRPCAEVEVHSDLRTAKLRALREDPRAAILLWDARAQLQVRLQVSVRIMEADPARWEAIPPEARLNYGTDPAPGLPVASPQAVTRMPSPDRFAALVARVHRIDVVSLAHDPHRRAVFGKVGSAWVAP